MQAQNRLLGDRYQKIKNGEIKLPQFQRYEAWDKKRIAGLLKSILQDLPMGITLILGVGDEEKFKSRYIESSSPENPARVTEHLLDGQQRITAFWRLMNNNYENLSFFVFSPTLCSNQERIEWYEKKQIEEFDVIGETRYLRNGKIFPLRTDDPKEIMKRGLIPTQFLSPGIDSANADERIKGGLSYKKDEDIENYYNEIQKRGNYIRELREKIKTYNLPYLELPTQTEKDIALEVFINMNTSGKPLKMYDIIVAEVEQEVGESLHTMQINLDKEYPYIKNYFDLSYLILNTSALLQEKMPNNKGLLEMNKAGLIKNRDEMKLGLHEMSEFLKTEKIYNKSQLPTNAVLSVIAASFPFIGKKPDEIGIAKTLLRKYLRSAIFSNHYDSSTNSKSYYDYINIKRILTKEKKENGEYYGEADIPVLKSKLTDPIELLNSGRPKKEGVKARGILALSLRFGAEDFATTDRVNEININTREYHHIFPQALLKEVGLNPDLALNCMLISQPTNREIGRKDPITYLSDRYEISSKDEVKRRLESHMIDIKYLENTNYDNLSIEEKKHIVEEQYNNFLTNRAKNMHKLIEKLCNGEGAYGINDIGEKEHINLNTFLKDIEEIKESEFKSTLRWRTQSNPPMDGGSEMEKNVLKTIAAFLNTEGGILLIGITDDKNIFGLEKDYEVLSKGKDISISEKRDLFRKHFDNIIGDNLGNGKHAFITLEITAIDNKDIAIVKVEKGPNPTYMIKSNNEFYGRRNASTIDLKGKDGDDHKSKYFKL